MSEKDLVDHRIPASVAIKAHSELPRTLMGGVPAMRDKGQVYLPVYELETVQDFSARLRESFIFDGYERAWKSLVGKVFDEAIVLPDDTAEELLELVKNVDRTGQDLDMFCQWVFADSLHPGMGHILVDHPTSENQLTVAEERNQGIRPYWVYVPAESVLGWYSEERGGMETLTHLRFEQIATERDGMYGVKQVRRVREYNLTDDGVTFAVHQEPAEGQTNWTVIDEGNMDPMTEIPLATFYARRTAFMESRPALDDLAWTNLEYWQSASAQRASLHFDRIFWPHFQGFTEKELEGIKGLGAGVMTASREGTVSVVERSQSGTGYGERDLERLRVEMQMLSLEPMLEKGGEQTARAREIDEAAAQSSLRTWVSNFEVCIDQAMGYTAQWVGAEYEDGANIPSEFGFTLGSLDEIKLLKEIGLSEETVWQAAKERGLLPDDWSFEDEQDRRSTAGPSLVRPGGGLLRGGALFGDQDEEEEDESTQP
jgi:hypothetical protein